MKVLIAIIFIFSCSVSVSNAQTAMQIAGVDCYGEPVDMFADLDAGKAIILLFYMPDCGACPPPGEELQEMATNLMVANPDMIQGFAFPFQDVTTCEYSISWVEDNHLPFFAPMDSGAYPVAYYGGFGMPTVVLLGGTDHRVMFSTLSFLTSDTTEMRDSIINLFGGTTDISNMTDAISNFNVYPNPANEVIEISADLSENSDLEIVFLDVTGRLIRKVSEGNTISGKFSTQIETVSLPEGIYLVRLISGENSMMKKITIYH